MRRNVKWLAAGLGIVAVVAIVGVASVAVLLRTDWGRDVVRRRALSTLDGVAHGQVHIGRIEGSLLGKFALVDVRIADSTGAPFVQIERIDARMHSRQLLSKRIELSDITLVRPIIHLVQSRAGEWNYERIFPRSDSAATDSVLGFGDWVTLHGVALEDGVLTVRRPWSPDEAGAAGTRDSLIAAALAGATRVRVERTGGSLWQQMAFTNIDGRLGETIIADPAMTGMRIDVDSLSMTATPFNPPSLVIRKFAGRLRIADDSLVIPDLRLALPSSQAAGSLTYLLGSGDVHVALKVPQLALADVRALYPELPETGTARLDLLMAIRDSAASEYTVTNATVAVGDARIEGRLGLVIDSLVRFRDTDLHAERVSAELVERLVPGVQVPLRGEASGRAILAGPMDDLQLQVDARLHPAGQPAFRVVARGGVGFGEAITARALSLRAERVPLSLARDFDVEMPVQGVVTVDGTLGGSSAGLLRGNFRVQHDNGGDRSVARLVGSVAPSSVPRFDVTAQIDRLSMGIVESFVDSLDLQGSVSGSAKVRGTPRQLTGEVILALVEGGRVEVEGGLQRSAGDELTYNASIHLRDVAPQVILPSLPIMFVDGDAELQGRGTDLATLDASLRSRLQLFMIDSAEFRNVAMDARAARGMLYVDTLWAGATFGGMTANGSVGLVDGREGLMRFSATVEDLGGLSRWIATGDTGVVEPRPAIAVRIARLRARADSLREHAVAANDPAAQLAADLRQDPARPPAPPGVVLPPVARDSVSGSFTVAGELAGSVKAANVSATAATPGIVWGGNLLGAGSVRAQWLHAFTSFDTLRVDGGVDSVRAAGFAFDSTRFRGSYHRGEGDAHLTFFPGDTAEYLMDAEYAVSAGEGELRLRDIRMRLDSTDWHSTRPSVVRWHGKGLTVDSLELRDGERANGARIFVNGEVPDVDAGTLEFVAERVRVAPWLTMLQSDVPLDGVFSAEATYTGTQRNPLLKGRASLVQASYDGVPYPETHATFDYDARRLGFDVRMRSDSGAELAKAAGSVPLDLTRGDSTVQRLPEAGTLDVSITGDSIPLAPLADLSDAIADLQGHGQGDIKIGGTWKKSIVTGDLGVTIPRVRLVETGVVLHNGAGQLHMAGDSLVVDSLVAYSGGAIRGQGAISFANLTNPTVRLTVQARDAQVLDDERGELFADADIQVSGPIDTLTVTGNAAITRGVLYIPDPEQFDVISTADPAVFSVVDTATALALGVEATPSALANLSMQLDLEVRRGTFARSSDANIEMYGNIEVRAIPGREDYLVTGSLYTDQGSYTFLGKRFIVSRGAVRFLGGETLNPVLQILAKYEVQQAGRAPFDIRVVIGGTLDRPAVSLESDAQPKLSQSDLISYLAFGRSSSALLQFSGTGLEGGGEGGVAALATRQLASIALGALVDAARADLVTATGADVLNITPAQLPRDLSLGGAGTLLRGTELEIGKYVDRRTFILGRIRPTLAIPGASIERRLTDRFTLRGTLETRYQPRTPSLSSGLPLRTIQLVGALLSWKFAW
ncbi:MAG: translocation/assembly module TamB domain-containing protein [Gemmatimonadaceae bacterium]